jgi:hypothetical protein
VNLTCYPARAPQPGYTKKDLEAAMHRLMGAGRLRRVVVGKYSIRAPRYGLVVP